MQLQYIILAVVGIVLSVLGVVFTLWCIYLRKRSQSLRRKFPASLSVPDKQKMGTSVENGDASENKNGLKPIPDEIGSIFRSMDATNHTYEEMVR